MNPEMLSIQTEDELKSILRYWINHAVDSKNGGFIGRISGDDKKQWDAEKGLVLNSRILWAFSAAYRYFPSEEYKRMADKSFAYLNHFFIDTIYGGAFWSVNFAGFPLQRHKQFYGLAFLLYGLTEYYRSFSNKEALTLAKEIFYIVEKEGYDDLGYIEACTENWAFRTDTIITAGQPRSMNTHLHILEAYTNLLRVWGNDVLRDRIKELLNIFSEKIIDKSTFTQGLFFSENWERLSWIVSFGHDIEASWLLMESAEILGNEELFNKQKTLSLKMAYNSLMGLDTDGGMFNESDEKGINREKHWWVQAEAMAGFMNAYRISGDVSFLNAVFKVWEFIKTRLLTDSGEWYWGIDEEDKIMIYEDKVGMWKCPYHNSRAMLEILKHSGTKNNLIQ